MSLNTYEQDVARVYVLSQIASARMARGTRLSIPEAEAVIKARMIEAARDGQNFNGVRDLALRVVKKSQVMENVPDLLRAVSCTCRFATGLHEVVVFDPIRDN